jgi:hypothetical protein
VQTANVYQVVHCRDAFLLVLTQTLFLPWLRNTCFENFGVVGGHVTGHIFPSALWCVLQKNIMLAPVLPNFFEMDPFFFLFFPVIPGMYSLGIMKKKEKNWSRYGHLVRPLFQ